MTTYDRVVREWRRKHLCGSDLRAKILAAKLERQDAHTSDEVVPGVVVALTIKRAAEKAALVLVSALLLASCAPLHTPTSYTYEMRTCPAPLTASACEQYLTKEK
jgi:hypothetical protein